MTVTLTAGELKQPIGELSNEYFPLGDLDEQLEGWLGIAIEVVEDNTSIATASHNSAAAVYVYYRAYDYIANQLAAMPNSQSEGDGAISVSIAVTQFRYFRDLAASKLALYGGLVVPSTGAFFFTTAPGYRGR